MFSYVLSILSRFNLVSLEKMERIMWRHLECYHLTEPIHDDTEDFECYDDLVHILLLFVAIDYPTFAETFQRGETKFFISKFNRLSLMGKKEKLSGLLAILKYFSQRESKKPDEECRGDQLNLDIRTLETMAENWCHVFDECHRKECEKLTMTLPFTFLLDLVAKRKVAVSNGKIVIGCGMWPEVLVVVYLNFLDRELMELTGCEPLREILYDSEDDRLRQLIKRFTNVLMGKIRGDDFRLGAVKADDIDGLVQYFPPCMANLHQILRKTHRLSYESRYQYTLFLKDIGMPVNENILFWETEYNQPCHGSACVHDWTEKKNRYKYQIEHVYGLIGCRSEKSSHSCEKFTGALESKMDGGCPFRHASSEYLRECIPRKIMEIPDVEDLFKYHEVGMPQSACSVYLSCQRFLFERRRSGCLNLGSERVGTCHVTHLMSPLQYFNLARNFVGKFGG